MGHGPDVAVRYARAVTLAQSKMRKKIRAWRVTRGAQRIGELMQVILALYSHSVVPSCFEVRVKGSKDAAEIEEAATATVLAEDIEA